MSLQLLWESPTLGGELRIRVSSAIMCILLRSQISIRDYCPSTETRRHRDKQSVGVRQKCIDVARSNESDDFLGFHCVTTVC
jgi:hypothetical protein